LCSSIILFMRFISRYRSALTQESKVMHKKQQRRLPAKRFTQLIKRDFLSLH
jgi:hypothetical protein